MSLPKKYARALFDESQRNGSGGTDCTGELRSFWMTVESSRELKLALTGPVTSSKEKAEVIQEIAQRLGFALITTRFLKLLAENNRIGRLPEVIDAFDEVRLETEGGTLGRIVSAEPLEAAALREISEAFKTKLKRKVEFRVTTDPSLLAGLKVTVNGVTYDGTLRAQLERLRGSFVQGSGMVQ